MRWGGLLLVAVTALSGCDLPYDCPLGEAQWMDRSLYAALSADARVTLPLPTNLSLSDPVLDASWGSYALTSVAKPFDGPGTVGFRLSQSAAALGPVRAAGDASIVMVAVDKAEDFRGERDRIESFLQALAPAGTDLAPIMAAMQANESVVGIGHAPGEPAPRASSWIEYGAKLPDGWGPQRLWDAIPDMAQAPSTSGPDPSRGLWETGDPGQAQLQNDGWAFSFALPLKSVEGLTIDAEGWASYRPTASAGNDEDKFRKLVHDEIATRGWPAPDPDALVLGHAECGG